MLRKGLSVLLAVLMAIPLSMLAAAAEADHTSAYEEEVQAVAASPAAVGEPVEQETVETGTVVEEEPPVEEVPVEEPLPAADFYVNGQPVYDAELFEVDGVAYAPIRPFFNAALPGCEISWSSGEAKVTGTAASGEALEVSACPGNLYIKANGRCLYVENGVQLINGSTMLPFSVLAKLFAGEAEVDGQGVWQVTLGDRLLASGEAFYHAGTLDLFSRLIHSESGNQSLMGRLAVGSVVLNRVDSPLFPATMYDVIFQTNQFSVVANGDIFNKTPSDLSITAAKLCLEGVRVSDALFFNVRGLKCWATYNRPYLETIGDHEFYL